MSFLDAISKVEKKEEAIEVNPLLKGKTSGDAPKKPSPFSKPSPFTKEPTAKEAPAAPAAPTAKPVFKAPTGLNKEAEPKETEIIKAKTEEVEAKTEEVKVDTAPEVTEPEVKPEIEEIETKEELKNTEVETDVIKNNEEALAEEPGKTLEEAIEEENKEEVKAVPKKRTRKTKTTTKDESSEKTEPDSIEMFSTEISYEEAIANISSPFINEEFEAVKQEIVSEINSIDISADMNSVTAKDVNSKLATLYQKIWFENQAAKALYDQLNQKDNGLIDRTRSLFIDGQNDAQRKRSGIEACIRFTSSVSDDAINLYEMLDSAREQHYFFKAAMEHLDFKKNVMISMNAALKIEEKVLGHEL